jgi:hypothetical protein
MSISLVLDSSKLTGSNPSNFTLNFSKGIELQEMMNQQKKYEIALITADLWYTWKNIRSSFGNNSLRYHNGTLWRTVTFPNGNYQVSDINDYLHERMKVNGDSTVVAGEDVFDVNLLANPVTIQVDIKLTNSYQIDLSVSTLNELLGFNSAIYNADVSSQNRVDITRGVNNLLIRCSIVMGSYDNTQGTDILYTFVPNTSRGSAIHIEPNNPIYVPIQVQDQIKTITMRITDQLNREIIFDGENVGYYLQIRPSKYQ